MAESTSCYNGLDGKEGLLDSIPDFILVTDDLEGTVREMGRRHAWKQKGIDKVLSFSTDTPFYFNVETSDTYEFPLKQGIGRAPISYKVGIVTKESFETDPNESSPNIILPSRLSKPLNVLDGNDFVADPLRMAREFVVGLALQRLGRRFTGKEFMEAYLRVTYQAEAYRINDLLKKKHLKTLMDQRF